MNAKIKELYDQSLEPRIERLGGSYYELNPEKFAELIVRDCLAIVAKNSGGPYDIAMTTETKKIWNIWIDITTHFGVKQ